MQLDFVRQEVGAAAFDYALDQFLRNGFTVARAVRTIAREYGVPTLTVGRTQTRFERFARIEQDYPADKRQRTVDPVARQLDFGPPPPPTITMGDEVNYRRSKLTIGSTKKRSANELFKAQIGGMEEYIFRWQACSNSLLGSGFLPLGFGWGNLSGAGLQTIPMHMMSLTTHPQFNEARERGCRKEGMCRIIYAGPNASPASLQADMGYQFFFNQDKDSLKNLDGRWEQESGPNGVIAGDQVFHKYTDIRLNLYGSLLVPLKYRVMLISGMPEEMQIYERGNPITTGGGIDSSDVPISKLNPLNQFIISHTRNVIGNPLTGSNSDDNYKGKFKMVSDKTYSIPCLSYGSAAAEASSAINSTNVKNVNMFIRHDRFRDYQWTSLAADIVRNNDIGGTGWNHTDTATSPLLASVCDVDREQRLFFVITCNAPSLINDNNLYDVVDSVGGPFQIKSNPPLPAPASWGSYDIVVRNCFRNGGVL